MGEYENWIFLDRLHKDTQLVRIGYAYFKEITSHFVSILGKKGGRNNFYSKFWYNWQLTVALRSKVTNKI